VKHGALQKLLGHLHYGALPLLKDMVVGLPDFKVERIGVCKGCARRQACQDSFPKQ
jgi:hypothetical protein